MSEVLNNQRKTKISKKLFQIFAENASNKISETENRSFTIAFVSDKKMRELNKTFRGKDSTTDVLSFLFEADEFDAENNNLGDIAISLEQAEKQAAENNLDFETEIKQLILHGILHLCGYDHETDDGEMNERELELRRKLGI
ncbi:MAG: rRNA maturation RNase YbeY [Acidobacteriota bacterium]